MINIIKEHLKQYPLMEIQDIAKLLFQSEFGGGHMISDKEKSLKWIQEESQTLANSQSPLAEYIGDGIVRVYLSSLNQGLRAEVLNEMFVQSAAHKKGSVKGLEEKIDAVRCVLPYSEDTIDAFFETWKAKGYPAISHSETYRSAYQPAYRVVDASYLKILDIIPSVNVSEKTPFVIAIDGMSGSGKSTLGELLHMNFPESNLFHMDDYFLQPHQRTKDRLAEIGGNVDYERFHEEILLHLTDKNGLTYRPYNCCTQSLEDAIHVTWQPLVIIEGSYSQHPYFGKAYDLKIFCEISAEEQKRRILARNGEFMWKRFESEWIPKEKLYFDTFGIKQLCLHT